MIDDTPLDDAALDVLVSETMRVNAPEGFALRVGAALDSRERSAHSRPWLRPALAVVAMLLLAVFWWWRQPVPVKQEVLRDTRAAAPETPSAPTSATGAGKLNAPNAPNAANSPNAPNAPNVANAPNARRAPIYVLVDHERALDALDDVSAVQQAAIDPAAIGPPTIDVQPADAITPLTIDPERPDPGGEGDH